MRNILWVAAGFVAAAAAATNGKLSIRQAFEKDPVSRHHIMDMMGAVESAVFKPCFGPDALPAGTPHRLVLRGWAYRFDAYGYDGYRAAPPGTVSVVGPSPPQSIVELAAFCDEVHADLPQRLLHIDFSVGIDPRTFRKIQQDALWVAPILRRGLTEYYEDLSSDFTVLPAKLDIDEALDIDPRQYAPRFLNTITAARQVLESIVATAPEEDSSLKRVCARWLAVFPARPPLSTDKSYFADMERVLMLSDGVLGFTNDRIAEVDFSADIDAVEASAIRDDASRIRCYIRDAARKRRARSV